MAQWTRSNHRDRSVVRTQLGMEQDPLARPFHGTVGFSELLVYITAAPRGIRVACAGESQRKPSGATHAVW